MIYCWRFLSLYPQNSLRLFVFILCFLKHLILSFNVHLLFLFTVPIIPEFLYDIRHPDAPLSSFPKTPPPMTTPADSDGLGLDYTTSGYGKSFGFLKWHNLNSRHFVLNSKDNVSWYAEREERHKELVDETAEIGVMFASKAFVQLLSNPFVGPLTHKYGHCFYLFPQSILILFISFIHRIGYRFVQHSWTMT